MRAQEELRGAHEGKRCDGGGASGGSERRAGQVVPTGAHSQRQPCRTPTSLWWERPSQAAPVYFLSYSLQPHVATGLQTGTSAIVSNTHSKPAATQFLPLSLRLPRFTSMRVLVDRPACVQRKLARRQAGVAAIAAERRRDGDQAKRRGTANANFTGNALLVLLLLAVAASDDDLIARLGVALLQGLVHGDSTAEDGRSDRRRSLWWQLSRAELTVGQTVQRTTSRLTFEGVW